MKIKIAFDITAKKFNEVDIVVNFDCDFDCTVEELIDMNKCAPEQLDKLRELIKELKEL